MKINFKILISNQLIRYAFASTIALFLDYLIYLIIAQKTKFSLPTAATISYTFGMVISYALMTSLVFKDGWLRKNRLLEHLFFIMSGLFGLTLTFVTSSLYINFFGEHLHHSRLIAVPVSFVGVYLSRKYIVFRV